MKNRGFLALIIPVTATILLLAGCPSPNNAAAAATVSNTTAQVSAAPEQPVTTGVPVATETNSTPVKISGQVSAPLATVQFEDIFIPDCCEPEVPAS